MARIIVEVENYIEPYLEQMYATVHNTVKELGADLNTVAKAAAPEKTSNLVNNITVNYSMGNGAYQADLESTAVDGAHDYVDWMHNGKYRLGPKSKTKPVAASKLGNFRKAVGREYLQGSGGKAKKGYGEYLMKQVDSLNKRWS